VPVAIRVLGPGSRDEARLREERYAALVAVARENGAARVALAHHARDQTETVLLALFRGTGPDGLGGMAPERELSAGLSIVRPLLDCEPEVLRDFCLTNHLAFALDATNVDTSLRRNAVRAMLEAARPQFPGLDAAVARCATILREERAGVPRALARKHLRAELAAALGDTRNVSFERVDALAAALERGAAGRHHVRRGVEAVLE
jgi:tRNA(Ile)-lysidine synthase